MAAEGRKVLQNQAARRRKLRKAGSDPEKAKILQLTRKVGAVVHTTGKIWRLDRGSDMFDIGKTGNTWRKHIKQMCG